MKDIVGKFPFYIADQRCNTSILASLCTQDWKTSI